MQDNTEKLMYLKGIIGQPLRGVVVEKDTDNIELHFDSAVLIVNINELFISIPERLEDVKRYYNHDDDVTYEPLL